ncbi:MAG TPA: transglutaminase family protein [Candidatus Binataceae bacterium]|nr:transglutaminase family protein [Candidatus Binataceae bacterium]
MRFQIRHQTRFEYERPAFDSHNEIRLRPWDGPTQRCLNFELRTTPAAPIVAYEDFYGNHGHSVSVDDPHDALTIVAQSAVEINMPPPQTYPETPFSRFLGDDALHTNAFYEFLAQSRYIPFSERLRKFFWMGARPQGMEDVTEYVMRVVAYVRDQFEYETTRTHVHSSINDILKSGGGVCQDFAHLTIGLLRLAGVPARYVSGYLAPATQAPGAMLGGQASHAWLEAWLPGPGWSGFDPTHGCRTDERHLGMAIGRDYGDVPPIRGTYRSPGAKSIMRVELSIARADEPGSADGAATALKLCSSQQ